jgi:poly(3-hydroxyalkanoate) synthetase
MQYLTPAMDKQGSNHGAAWQQNALHLGASSWPRWQGWLEIHSSAFRAHVMTVELRRDTRLLAMRRGPAF